MEGKRQRKKVERLSLISAQESPKEKQELPEGKGDKLGDIARIEFHIAKFHAEELKPLHRILFSRTGSVSVILLGVCIFCKFLVCDDLHCRDL